MIERPDDSLRYVPQGELIKVRLPPLERWRKTWLATDYCCPEVSRDPRDPEAIRPTRDAQVISNVGFRPTLIVFLILEWKVSQVSEGNNFPFFVFLAG